MSGFDWDEDAGDMCNAHLVCRIRKMHSMESKLHKHEYDRKLTPTERKEIAAAFGWKDVDGVCDNLIGCRPMYDASGRAYAWMDDERVPNYDYDTLRFIRVKR